MVDSNALINDAEARLNRGDLAGALGQVRSVLVQDQQGGERWARVTALAQRLGDYGGALAAARRWREGNPSDPIRNLTLADILGETGNTEEALLLSQEFVRMRPTDPAPHYYVGQFEARLGRFDSAIAHFRQAAAFKPDLTAAWEQVAALKTFQADDQDLKVMEGARKTLERAGAETRAPLLYALGKAYDDLGETDRAFAAFSEGAQLTARARPWDAARFEAHVAGMIADFDRAFVDRQIPSTVQSDRAIFVTGLPRSGTTLVEQMLASHSAVKDGGELNLFRLATLPLGGFRPAVVEVAMQTLARQGVTDPWGGFAEAYLGLLDERFGTEGRIVDKTLNHTQLLGAIRLALPVAPYLWIQRDPRDVAWSCFRTRFARGEDWSWRFEDMARYIRAVERLHDHWAELFDGDQMSVRYEDLVADPETWTPKILGWCGLPDEAGVRQFHANPRAVSTASLAQVRKPISQGAVGGWRRYERQMAPFLEAYDRFKGA